MLPKFGHVSKCTLDVLHWIPAEQRISYRIASMVWRCLLGLASVYLRELCCPLLSAMSSRSLRSSQQGLLLVPVARRLPPLSRAVLFPWWVPRSGMGSLLNFGFSLEPCRLRVFLTLRLLFLTVLGSGAPLSSSLEKALYKYSVRMNG